MAIEESARSQVRRHGRAEGQIVAVLEWDANFEGISEELPNPQAKRVMFGSEGKGECDSRLWRHKQVLRGMGGSRSASAFLTRWSRSCRGRSWRRWSNRTIRRGKTDGLRWDWASCCGSTFCNSGST